MKIEQDPLIRRLFDLAGQEAVGEDFIADVMARIEALRRRTIILWGCVVLVLVGVAWFFTVVAGSAATGIRVDGTGKFHLPTTRTNECDRCAGCDLVLACPENLQAVLLGNPR
jgi:hypothetical protein